MALVDLANPTRYLGVFGPVAAVAVGGVGRAPRGRALLSLFVAPPDYQMGDTVRIMYIHVPNAWLSEFVYAVMAVAALGTLVWRHPLADVPSKAAAPLGAAFTFMALVTGSLWGRPTWGTFWVWDGRMTSTLVLFLIYLGLIALWHAFEDQAARRGWRRLDPGRGDQHAGDQVLGRLVEHAAPGRGIFRSGARPSTVDAVPLLDHDRGLHAVVFHFAWRRCGTRSSGGGCERWSLAGGDGESVSTTAVSGRAMDRSASSRRRT